MGNQYLVGPQQPVGKEPRLSPQDQHILSPTRLKQGTLILYLTIRDLYIYHEIMVDEHW